MKLIGIFILIHLHSLCSAQLLPGFKPTANFDEQELQINNKVTGISIEIVAPLNFSNKGKTFIVFFALPNGNSIEWTKGKQLTAGDDWHYDIQHVAAQTRFVRSLDRKNNYVLVYLLTQQQSWPAWKRAMGDAPQQIKQITDSVTGIFQVYDPHIVLNGHSGGGSFIFGYLDAVESIPTNLDRIAFLDSDYGYETGKHQEKLVDWLKQSKKNNLIVLSYNDSIVIYNGKPLVSATGGTWYRSRLMQKDLSSSFAFNTSTDTAFIRHTALNGRIQFHLKQNPTGLIYHTVQVEKNGLIYSLLSNTRFDKKKYFSYFGERVYNQFIFKQ